MSAIPTTGYVASRDARPLGRARAAPSDARSRRSRARARSGAPPTGSATPSRPSASRSRPSSGSSASVCSTARAARGRVSLTEAGEVLLAHAAAIVARLEAAHADLRALADGEAGTLRVGVYQSVGARILPILMQRFHARLARRPAPGRRDELRLGAEADRARSSAASSTSPSVILPLPGRPSRASRCWSTPTSSSSRRQPARAAAAGVGRATSTSCR